MKRALVIGGGWAGLSCAVELARRGMRVTVLEQSRRLGGRASSFRDAATGEVVDNGQHLMMGCYRATLEFLRTIGSDSRLRFQDDLTVPFVQPGGRQSILRCRALPAPLHLFSGILGLATLSWREKIALLNVYRNLAGNGAGLGRDSLTAERWLAACGQSSRALRCLWEPITLATLNEHLDVAGAESLAVVLKEAFFGSRADSRLIFSKVGLSDLCGPGSESYLRARNGEVLRDQLVTRLEVEGGRCAGVMLRDGRRRDADCVVSAVPFFVLRNLLPESWRRHPFFEPLERLQSSPIFSISLWFDRPILGAEFAGLLETRLHWAFDKSRILGVRSDRRQIACVISGARSFLNWKDEDLLQAVREELDACFPQARSARVLGSLIQREKNATLSPAVGVSARRPVQTTPLRNFYLCGDWTATGYPATIESAVLSGRLAAQAAEHGA